MDKNQSKQIAEALGLYEKQDGFLAFWFSPEGWKITLPGGRFVVGKDLEVWLESPAGEKAVRDKVRELCKELGLSFIYHWAYWGGTAIVLYLRPAVIVSIQQEFVILSPPRGLRRWNF